MTENKDYTVIPDNVSYPLPLKQNKEPVPFPLYALPQVIRDMTSLISETVQVAPEMPASVALAVLSLCLQGKAKISFSSFYNEELNLYVMISAAPGERKTPVYKALTSPIYAFMTDYNNNHHDEIMEYIHERRILENQLERAITKEESIAKVNEIQHKLDSLTPKLPLKLITSDTTAESLVDNMAANGDRMAIMSDEGGQFSVMSGMYSKSGASNLNIYLSGYDGTPTQVDRKCGSTSLEHPLLTIGICVQPKVLNDVLNNNDFTGKGLVQRFLITQPMSMVGHRSLIVDELAEGIRIRESYRKLIYRLLSFQPDNPILDIYSDAAEIFRSFSETIEMQMADGGMLEYHRDYFGKLPGKILRIAGLLHYADENHKLCVSGETMQNAIEIAKYYGQQYLAAVGADNYDSTAKVFIQKILQKARRDSITRISLRDIKRTVGKNFSQEQIVNAIEQLMQNDYLRLVSPAEDTRRSNNRKEIYDINPYLLLPEAENIPLTN